MEDAFAECDIVISPERYCSFGLSICESIASGKPTILSDIPTYLEIGEGVGHAFFFKSESVDCLAQTIGDVIDSEDENVLTRDVINFRRRFDMRNCANAYAELYMSY